MNAWQQILNEIKPKVNGQSYQTWLRPTRLIRAVGDTLFVQVPHREFQEWVHENYGSLIRDAIERLRLGFAEVRYVCDESAEKRTGPNAEVQVVQGKFDFESVDHQLNLNYTFDSFVVGPCNQFARAAALAVAEAPSTAYNPLFLYGGVGLGKTHLMQAVGHQMKKNRKEMRVAYVDSEKFTNELINSVRYDRMISFREKYRSVDALLIDDIEFIAGKERTQEEFFHTFNTLFERKKQVVLSSDCPPKEIPGLEERLRSRFAWGLTADLQPPDLETKMVILATKCEEQGITLPAPVMDYVASRIRSSIRDLEGALTRLVAYSSLTGAEITLALAQQVLKNMVDEDERRVTIDHIQRAVCKEFPLSLIQLKSKNNSRAVAYPRQIGMYLAKQLTPASLPQIGREFGGKHHSTVIHSITKIERLRRSDRDLNRIINKLIESLR